MSAPPLVREVMTIGVPVCRDAETCGAVRARLAALPAPVVVALDEAGLACGWTTLAQLAGAPADQPVSAVLDEDIPTVPPDIPAAAAAQIMRDRGIGYLFLMHAWPGEPRPAAMLALATIERRLQPDAAETQAAPPASLTPNSVEENTYGG